VLGRCERPGGAPGCSAPSGLNLAATKKFRNIAANPKVAFVVDDVLPPWQPRSAMIQGSAGALEPPDSGEALIRITPRNVISWSLGPAV
jgi:pyridoxamine 5'-phosphate oxidase family protein